MCKRRSRVTITGTSRCEPWLFTLSESKGRRLTLDVVSAGQKGWLETPSKTRLSDPTQDRNPSNGSRGTSSSGRNEHPVARWNESVSARGNRQLLQAELIVDARGTAWQRQDLSDIGRGRSRGTNGGKSSRRMRRMGRGGEFRGFAITTAALQNVLSRSSVEIPAGMMALAQSAPRSDPRPHFASQ